MTTQLIRAVIAASCVLAFATPAQAQLGGLIKKAAGKVMDDKVKEKTDEMKPVPPMDGEPVTASTLDNVLKGLSFEVQQQAEAVRLKKIQEAKAQAYYDAEKAGHDEAAAYRKSNDKIMSCVGSALHDLEAQHQQELQARAMNMMNDPKMQEMIKETAEIARRAAEAAQKGDTAAVRRISSQMMRAQGVDLPADSAKAYQKCGQPAPPPASYVKTEKAAAELRDANEDLRKVETNLSKRAAETAGMEPKSYYLSRERIWAWNSARKSKANVGITAEEKALFDSRSRDIDKVAAALR